MAYRDAWFKLFFVQKLQGVVYSITHKATEKVPPLMAAIAASLVVIYIVGELEFTSSASWLFSNGEASGMVFGVLSAVLFVTAFVLELRKRSIITAGLLVSGGATMGTLSMAKDVLAESGIVNIALSFSYASSIGYIIMSLGLLHLVKLLESKD